MSYINSFSKMVFGGTAGGDQAGRAHSGANNQKIPEVLAVGSTSRAFKGPQRNGHFSIHLRCTEAAAAGSLITVWYSNLPNPDVTADADWVQDTSITTLVLDATGNVFVNVGNVNAEHVRLKATALTDTASAWCWVRSEGVDH